MSEFAESRGSPAWNGYYAHVRAVGRPARRRPRQIGRSRRQEQAAPSCAGSVGPAPKGT